jgi:hypothetical protein
MTIANFSLSSGLRRIPCGSRCNDMVLPTEAELCSNTIQTYAHIYFCLHNLKRHNLIQKTMKLFSATISPLFFLASSCSTVQAQKQKRGSIRAAATVGGEQYRRNGKKGGNIGGTDDFDGLINEPGAPGSCTAFEDSTVADAIQKGQGGHDTMCDTENNACGSDGSPACCRVHTNLLSCDYNNEYRFLPVRGARKFIFAPLKGLLYIFHFCIILTLFFFLFHFISVYL